MKMAEDFAQELAITRSQNAILIEDLEKAEVIAQELEVKVKLLEENVKTREVEVKLKKDWMKKEEEHIKDNKLLERIVKRKVYLDIVQK